MQISPRESGRGRCPSLRGRRRALPDGRRRRACSCPPHLNSVRASAAFEIEYAPAGARYQPRSAASRIRARRPARHQRIEIPERGDWRGRLPDRRRPRPTVGTAAVAPSRHGKRRDLLRLPTTARLAPWVESPRQAAIGGEHEQCRSVGDPLHLIDRTGDLARWAAAHAPGARRNGDIRPVVARSEANTSRPSIHGGAERVAAGPAVSWVRFSRGRDQPDAALRARVPHLRRRVGPSGQALHRHAGTKRSHWQHAAAPAPLTACSKLLTPRDLREDRRPASQSTSAAGGPPVQDGYDSAAALA